MISKTLFCTNYIEIGRIPGKFSVTNLRRCKKNTPSSYKRLMWLTPSKECPDHRSFLAFLFSIWPLKNDIVGTRMVLVYLYIDYILHVYRVFSKRSTHIFLFGLPCITYLPRSISPNSYNTFKRSKQ